MPIPLTSENPALLDFISDTLRLLVVQCTRTLARAWSECENDPRFPEVSDDSAISRADLANFPWQTPYWGLYQLPVAA